MPPSTLLLVAILAVTSLPLLSVFAYTLQEDELTDNEDFFTLSIANVPIININIKPNSDPNSINIRGAEKVAVAILTTPAFDATTVVPGTVIFTGASVARKNSGRLMFSLKDVDLDGDTDMLVHFLIEELLLSPGDTRAGMEGETIFGIRFIGGDLVKVVE